jgi:preprotein translocase subunit Sec63
MVRTKRPTCVASPAAAQYLKLTYPPRTALLGVDKSASPNDIKKAYRKVGVIPETRSAAESH